MKIDYNISNSFNSETKSLIFLSWLPGKKNFEEMTSDDFFTIDDVTVSESGGVTTYSHIEVQQFYKYGPSNLSEITDNFNFIVEITFEKVDYFKTKIVTSKKMQSIRLMTFEILSRNKNSQLSDWGSDKRIDRTHTIEIRPIKILERDCVDGKYELNLLIKEFLRDSKLDDLGL
jgi:hypothetical protein